MKTKAQQTTEKKRIYYLEVGDRLNPNTAVTGYEAESSTDRAARMWALALCDEPCPAWFNDPADPGIVHNRTMTLAKFNRLRDADFKALVLRYIAEENTLSELDGSDSIETAVGGLLRAARATLTHGKLPRDLRADLDWAVGDVEEWINSIEEQSGGYFDRYIAGDR